MKKKEKLSIDLYFPDVQEQKQIDLEASFPRLMIICDSDKFP